MFADVRGYTDFTSTHGADAAAELVARFTGAVSETVGIHGGEVRGTWGDEVFAVFDSARDAVRAAVAVQERCMAATLADGDVPLVVGVGLDAGEAVASAEATSGSAVNVAARLCSRAAAGEVLTTTGLAHLAGAVPGVAFEEHGRAKLKGVPGRTRLVRVRSTSQDKAQLAAFRTVVGQLPARKRERRRRRAWVAGLAAAALVVGAGTWSLTRLRAVGPPIIAAGAVGVIDADSGRLEATVTLPSGHHADAVVVGKTAAWLVDSQAGVVFRVDRDTRQVVQRIPVGANPVAAVESGGFLWVANEGDGTVSQINENVNEQVETLPVGKQPDAITVGFGYLWVADRADNQVTRLDPAQAKPIRSVNVGDAPAGVAAAGGSVWVTNSMDNTVSTIDPVSLTVSAPILVGAGPQAILATGSGVFVANNLELNVSRIDPVTRDETARIPVGDAPAGLAAVGDSVWVTDAAGATLTKIDGKASRAAATWAVGSSPGALASDGSRLWVTTRAFASAAHRGGTLTVAIYNDEFDTVDPATTYFPWTFKALSMVYDGLVTLRRTSGPEGLELVPDLAVRLPRPSPDGTGQQYEFALRAGIRYSDGRTVRPEDVRRGLERMFTANTPTYGGEPQYYTGIVGGAKCLDKPTTCSLAGGVTTDDGTNTVTIHLTKPDPDFLYKLAMTWATVVPPGTPMTDDRYQPYPGTGPYMISNFTQPDTLGIADAASGKITKESLTLVRNPHFRQWSSAAQPAGYPDVIRWRPMPPDKAYRAVEAGTADLMEPWVAPGQPVKQVLDSLHANYPDQFHRGGLGFSTFLFLDTRHPPFNDRRARQALALAINRATLASYLNVPVVTCDFLPPNYPGYQPYCPYTSSPDAAGDLQLGRQLVTQSGTKGYPVHVFLDRGQAEAAKYLVEVLKSLGYQKASYRLTPPGLDYQFLITRPKTVADVGWNGWQTDFPAASGYYLPLFHCGIGFEGWFCNHALDHNADTALATELTDPGRAQSLWQEVYQQIAVQAPIIPFGIIPTDYLVSVRANANYQAGWLNGPILDEMWVQ
jgi:YVTN family beta-propeller protein